MLAGITMSEISACSALINAARNFPDHFGRRAGEDGKVGSILGAALKEDETVDAIARIIDRFLVLRTQDEGFLKTLDRLGELPSRKLHMKRFDLKSRVSTLIPLDNSAVELPEATGRRLPFA